MSGSSMCKKPGPKGLNRPKMNARIVFLLLPEDAELLRVEAERRRLNLSELLREYLEKGGLRQLRRG